LLIKNRLRIGSRPRCTARYLNSGSFTPSAPPRPSAVKMATPFSEIALLPPTLSIHAVRPSQSRSARTDGAACSRQHQVSTWNHADYGSIIQSGSATAAAAPRFDQNRGNARRHRERARCHSVSRFEIHLCERGMLGIRHVERFARDRHPLIRTTFGSSLFPAGGLAPSRLGSGTELGRARTRFPSNAYPSRGARKQQRSSALSLKGREGNKMTTHPTWRAKRFIVCVKLPARL
jgi:hypothetical protein